MRSFIFRRMLAAHAFAIASGLTLCGVAFGATVVLGDGTMIKGDVIALQDGVYTIATAAVGTLHVRKQEVRSIDETDKAGAKSGVGVGTDASSPEIDPLDAAKSRIAEDPRLLAMVAALQNDPAVLAVLADPEIAKAIAAGDYVGLMNNPKIIGLMANEKVRAIIDATR